MLLREHSAHYRCVPLQGALRNKWFLGALACVATRRDLVLDLIVSDNAAAAGLYTFQFYKHGCWHHVVVDDHLPCVLGQDEILFACSGTAGAPARPSLSIRSVQRIRAAQTRVTLQVSSG